MAELPVLASEAPHNQALSLAAVALPKAHPSPACLGISSVPAFSKARNTCSIPGLLLLLGWSRAGSGLSSAQGTSALPKASRQSMISLPLLLPQLDLQPGPSPAPTQSSQCCSWSFPSLFCPAMHWHKGEAWAPLQGGERVMCSLHMKVRLLCLSRKRLV